MFSCRLGRHSVRELAFLREHLLIKRVGDACYHFATELPNIGRDWRVSASLRHVLEPNKINRFGMKAHHSVQVTSELQNRVHQFNSGRGRRCGAHGLAGRRPSRCNASMIIRRLIAWFRFRRPQPLQRRTVLEAAGDRTAEFDLAEFGRLLSSGRREDLKKIAQVMSQPDRARLRSGR